MARAAAARIEEERPPHDALEGVALPRANTLLVGHAAAERKLLDAYRSGRMHHGWIFAGDRGIGRATLAIRLARFIFAHPDPAAREVMDAINLFVPPDHSASRRVAIGAHPNLLHLQREWSDRDRRFRSELSVESVRRIIPFLGTTAGEPGWRVVIVDPADDMNRSAANAILKNLEEPPRRTLFILITRSRGTLLPTILSRCRGLDLAPLSPEEVAKVVAEVAPTLAGRTPGALAMALSAGSPRRLIELELYDGEETYRLMLAAVEGGDRSAQLALSGRAADPMIFRQFADLFEDYLSRRVRGVAVPAAEQRGMSVPLVTWANLWEKAALRGQEVEEYNLDRRQYVLDLLETAAGVLHRSAAARPA